MPIAAVTWQVFYGTAGVLFGTFLVALSFVRRYAPNGLDKTLNAFGTLFVGFGTVLAFLDPATQYLKDGKRRLSRSPWNFGGGRVVNVVR